jgi:hypothetical protein
MHNLRTTLTTLIEGQTDEGTKTIVENKTFTG